MRTGYAPASARARLVSATAIVALHAAVFGALWQLEPVRSALTSVAPIMVSVVEPARPKIEAPEPLPPKPVARKPVTPRPQPQPVAAPPAPVLSAAPEAPAVQTVSQRAPAPVEPAPVAAPAPVVVATAPPAPVPVTLPRFDADYLNNPPPAYPPISRRMREEGKVVLRVHVNIRGLPDDVQVRTSSGSDRLDGAAQDVVRRWKFVPARRGETPVDAWVLVPISFTL